MKRTINDERFDLCIEPSDWRYAAAIVGLCKYLRRFGEADEDYEISDEYLKCKSADITEERYLQFVESEYGEELQYKKLEHILLREEYSESVIKLANELMKGNSINKRVFGKLKFDGTNQSELLELIQLHRMDLIKETFRNKSNMYANFANTGQLFEGTKACCRLVGYYVDGGRKSKSVSYNFDTSTFQFQDDNLFDFIPFSFSGDREMFFVNDNCSIKQLNYTNSKFKDALEEEIIRSEGKSRDARKVLFKSIQEMAGFIDMDMEVIVKNRDTDYFETLFLRKESIQILKKIKVYDPFCFSIKINDNYYINVQKRVMDCILNLQRTDVIIEFLLKQSKEQRKGNAEYIISELIRINGFIDGGGDRMKQSMKATYACAKEVVKKLPENKRETYRQKLTSAIVFKDYGRFCDVLIQLSNYTDVTFDFAYDLFEDFEKNKDIAYTFINALTKKYNGETEK